MPETDGQTSEHWEICTAPHCCPLCGRPNECRMESGEAFKGPCWCARLTVSPAALERLLGHVAERRCLCPICLERIAADPEVTPDELRLG